MGLVLASLMAPALVKPVELPPAPPPVPLSTVPLRGPSLPPQPMNVGSWVTSVDYPPSSMRRKEQGTVAFRLLINRWGGVADCDIQQSSGFPALDDETCRLIVRRGRFYPATGPNEQPVSGEYANRIMWRLPEIPPEPAGFGQASRFIPTDGYPRPPRMLDGSWSRLTEMDYPAAALAERREGTTLLALDVDLSGKVKSCTVRQSSGHADLDAAACRIAHARATFAPAVDRLGKPVEGRMLTGIGWFPDNVYAARPSLGEPVRPGQPFSESGTMMLKYRTTRDGGVDQCLRSGDVLSYEALQLLQLCSFIERYPDFRFRPFVDENGKPVSRAVSVSITASVASPDNEH